MADWLPIGPAVKRVFSDREITSYPHEEREPRGGFPMLSGHM